MGKYYHTKESVEEYIRMAEGHDGRIIIARLNEYLPIGSSLLEIGSGPGTDWKILNECYKVRGSDNSEEFLKHLQANNPGGEFLLLDAVSLDTPLSFEGIYSNKVLHHLEDKELERSIKRQFEILNSGGIICHTFWKGEDSEIYNDLFVNYHSDEDISMRFEKYFDAQLLQFYKEFEKNDSFLYIGKKKEEQPT